MERTLGHWVNANASAHTRQLDSRWFRPDDPRPRSIRPGCGPRRVGVDKHLMRFGTSRGFAFAFLVCASLVPARARAVGTRVFELDSLEKLSGGELQGVAVGSDGVVRAGWTLSNIDLPPDTGTTVACALALPDGSVLVGTGPASGGKVVRVANDRATLLADTRESAVSALAVDRAGVVYAATTGNKIYRVTAGRAEVFATVPDVDSILALAIDKAGD